MRKVGTLVPWRNSPAIAAGRLDVAAGWAIGKRGDVRAGLELLSRGRPALAAVPDVQHNIFALVLEADVLLAAGRPNEAVDRLDEGLVFNDHSGAALWLPELHRLRGESIRALGGPIAAAAAAFARARSVALEQGAHVFVRRADASAASLAAQDD